MISWVREKLTVAPRILTTFAGALGQDRVKDMWWGLMR